MITTKHRMGAAERRHARTYARAIVRACYVGNECAADGIERIEALCETCAGDCPAEFSSAQRALVGAMVAREATRAVGRA